MPALPSSAARSLVSVAVGLATVTAVLQPHPALAGARLLTREQALELAFPGASIRAERVFLTGEQRQRAAKAAGVDVPTALVARYIATRGGASAGRAYVDTHVVRTKRESLLISLEPDRRVRRIDVVAFLEPDEYQAPSAFLDQFKGRGLDDDLQLQRAIRPIAGATLTARAVNEATRRVLAIDRVLEGDDTAGLRPGDQRPGDRTR